VGLNQQQGAVVKDSSGLHSSGSGLTTKPELTLALVRSRSISSVNSVESTVNTKLGADGTGSFLLGIATVSGSNNLSPCINGVLSDELHTNANIAGHSGGKVSVE